MLIHHEGTPITSMEAWRVAISGAAPARWKAGTPGHDLALAWCPEGQSPAPPVELGALLDTPLPLGRLELLGAEPAPLEPGVPGAVLRMEAQSKLGPVAVHLLAWGEAPLGPRVETELRAAVQAIARDEDSDRVEVIRSLARLLLPPPTARLPASTAGEGTGPASPGQVPAPPLEPLGSLRWELLRQVGEARRHAVEGRMERVLFVLHEIVSLRGTRESRRRNNREDLDRFVRRLSGGSIPRLQRGIVAGPVPLPGVDLYLAKIRRDLP